MRNSEIHILIGVILLLLVIVVFVFFVDSELDAYHESSEVISFNEFGIIAAGESDSLEVDENYCFEFEFYDPVNDECVFEVECEDDQCDVVDDFYDRFLAYLEELDYFVDGIAFHSEDLESDLVNEFLILADDSLQKEFGEQEALASEIWSFFSRLIPNNWRGNLSYFGLFTDGVDSTLAYVTQRNPDDNPSIWIMGVDYEDYSVGDTSNFTRTLVHEFAHIFSLSDSQVDYEVFDDCTTLQLDEGCILSDSYMYDFFDSFWLGSKYYDHQRLVEEYGEEQAYFELFDIYYGQFVSEYAATNVVEDFAESFTSFILLPSSQIENSIEKVRFFANFPELQELRGDIRMNIGRLK